MVPDGHSHGATWTRTPASLSLLSLSSLKRHGAPVVCSELGVLLVSESVRSSLDGWTPAHLWTPVGHSGLSKHSPPIDAGERSLSMGWGDKVDIPFFFAEGQTSGFKSS